jgi:hypothetical protein
MQNTTSLSSGSLGKTGTSTFAMPPDRYMPSPRILPHTSQSTSKIREQLCSFRQEKTISWVATDAAVFNHITQAYIAQICEWRCIARCMVYRARCWAHRRQGHVLWHTTRSVSSAVSLYHAQFLKLEVTVALLTNLCSLKLLLRLRVESASRERLCRIVRLEMQWSLQSSWEAKIRALEMQWRWGCHLERLILTGCW